MGRTGVFNFKKHTALSSIRMDVSAPGNTQQRANYNYATFSSGGGTGSMVANRTIRGPHGQQLLAFLYAK